jgi:pimeloyl-ACP methyl ester carboxylesterase
VHGAGSGPWIYEDWGGVALDLQVGLDVARASMRDYADAIVRAAPAEPFALVGWSLGGLAVMLAAERARPQRLVLLEPSPPMEVQGADESVRPESGTFDPEQVYGAFPPGVRARLESSLARAERKRGISVPSLPCPTLVVYGDEFAEERGRAVARRYGAEELCVPGLDHWGLVLDPRVRAAVRGYLSRSTA